MRIMFVIPKMTNGGAERVVANLCNYWCKDNEVRIVAIASKKSFYKLDKRVELSGQDIIINRKNAFTTFCCFAKFYPKAVNFVKKNIKEFKPDCVISLLVEADFVTYFAVRKNKNVVKVFSERADPTRRKKVRQMMAKKAYSICDLFVCQTKKIFDYYSCIPDDKKVVIPNPLDKNLLPAPVSKEKNHDIVSVGRLSSQKNHQLLIDSFVRSLEKLPGDCRLIIYGDGPEKKNLLENISKNNVGNRIKLAGVSDDVLNEIKDTSLFVLSSDYEGFPNALLEAMAMGIPVISTDFYTGAARELIGRDNGVVVPVGDEEEMSGAMTHIMNDDKMRADMRENNVFVREKYSIEKIGDLWMKSIERLVRR